MFELSSVGEVLAIAGDKKIAMRLTSTDPTKAASGIYECVIILTRNLTRKGGKAVA